MLGESREDTHMLCCGERLLSLGPPGWHTCAYVKKARTHKQHLEKNKAEKTSLLQKSHASLLRSEAEPPGDAGLMV